jgi:beta-glucosidase-like glycosyl hydrolase
VRNGRNYEYHSEDPWVSAVMAAEAVNGIQSQNVISTLKHYTLNCNETNRHWLDAIIAWSASLFKGVQSARPNGRQCGGVGCFLR